MGSSAQKNSSAASQARRVVDEVLKVAQSGHASASVSGGSKAHVMISKQLTDYNDTYFRSMLSGIEFATRGHFAQGRESPGYSEWILRSRLIDVTVRCTKS